MTIDDAAQIVKGTIKVKSTEDKNDSDKLESLTTSGVVTIFFGFIMLLSIIFAPYLIDINYREVINILRTELDPWP